MENPFLISVLHVDSILNQLQTKLFFIVRCHSSRIGMHVIFSRPYDIPTSCGLDFYDRTPAQRQLSLGPLLVL